MKAGAEAASHAAVPEISCKAPRREMKVETAPHYSKMLMALAASVRDCELPALPTRTLLEVRQRFIHGPDDE